MKKPRLDKVDLPAEDIEKLRAEMPEVTITAKALTGDQRSISMNFSSN